MWLMESVLEIAAFYGVKAHLFKSKERYTLTWGEFRKLYESYRSQQVKTGEIEMNTFDSYCRTLKQFDCFMTEQKIYMLRDIDVALIDRFKAWRAGRIKTIRKRTSKGQPALDLEINHLHCVFKFALDRELIKKNPVRFTASHWDPNRGAQPYSGDDLLAMREHAEHDLFLFVFFKNTGFRRSDAAMLLWREIHFDRGEGGEIEHVCKKNGKRVTLPISEELLRALEAQHRSHNALPADPVLLTEPILLKKGAAPG
jgi:integrase